MLSVLPVVYPLGDPLGDPGSAQGVGRANADDGDGASRANISQAIRSVNIAHALNSAQALNSAPGRVLRVVVEEAHGVRDVKKGVGVTLKSWGNKTIEFVKEIFRKIGRFFAYVWGKCITGARKTFQMAKKVFELMDKAAKSVAKALKYLKEKPYMVAGIGIGGVVAALALGPAGLLAVGVAAGGVAAVRNGSNRMGAALMAPAAVYFAPQILNVVRPIAALAVQHPVVAAAVAVPAAVFAANRYMQPRHSRMVNVAVAMVLALTVMGFYFNTLARILVR